MRAILITGIAAGIAFLFALILVVMIIKLAGKSGEFGMGKKIRYTFYAWIFFFVFGAFGYFGIYYHSDSTAGKYMSSTDEVEVSQISGGYLFDGSGDEDVLIFYPGAKVDEKAYAPIMYELAERGVDCILVKMPIHMAFLKKNAADEYINEYGYENYYLGGHSLGGAMASIYSASHHEDVDGLVLLASYPSAKIADDRSFCSVRGSNDGVMNMEAYEASRVLWSRNGTEYVIDGGNHAQFGSYGEQRGDGEATIPASEQWKLAVEVILNTIEG